MKIFISGIGAVSGIGMNVPEHIDSFRKNKHGMEKVTLFPTRHTVPVSEVKATNNQLKDLLRIESGKTCSRTALLGILAAKEAWVDAGIEQSKPWRIGLLSSTSNGGMDLTEQFYPQFRNDSQKGKLRQVAHHDAGDSTEAIARYLGLKGFRTTISTACSSAANAILLGSRLIEQNMLDIVIAGGTDALCKFTLNGFSSLMILDKELTRPFDENRAGLNLGEGAGYIVLQSDRTLSHTPYCELAGYGNANDAFHQTASSGEGTGAYLAMKKALEKASIQPEEISYVNAHGTGTPNNDLSESIALKRIFGEKVPPFSSTKPFTGHTLGAAGGLEAVFSVLALHHGFIYPNANFTIPINETQLIPQTTFQEDIELKSIVSNSFGFGGNNTSLLFRKTEMIPFMTPELNSREKTEVYINGFTSNYDLKEQEDISLLSIIPDQLDKSMVPNPTIRRRMSRIVKMGVATALSCLKENGNRMPDAILTATGLGCLTDTEKFMVNLLNNEEELLTPTAFIQSTFNTIGGQIALLTQNHCYNTTYVHRGISLESAFLDAISLIKENPSQHILCGSTDEMTPTLATLLKRIRYPYEKTPGEGSAFFLLSGVKNQYSCARLVALETIHGHYSPKEVYNKIEVFLLKNSCPKAKIISPKKYKTLCGEFPTAVSFALWKELTEMKKGTTSEPVLIYNQFIENHSFILLEPV